MRIDNVLIEIDRPERIVEHGVSLVRPRGLIRLEQPPLARYLSVGSEFADRPLTADELVDPAVMRRFILAHLATMPPNHPAVSALLHGEAVETALMREAVADWAHGRITRSELVGSVRPYLVLTSGLKVPVPRALPRAAAAAPTTRSEAIAVACAPATDPVLTSEALKLEAVLPALEPVVVPLVRAPAPYQRRRPLIPWPIKALGGLAAAFAAAVLVLPLGATVKAPASVAVTEPPPWAQPTIAPRWAMSGERPRLAALTRQPPSNPLVMQLVERPVRAPAVQLADTKTASIAETTAAVAPTAPLQSSHAPTRRRVAKKKAPAAGPLAGANRSAIATLALPDALRPQ